jgi:hypothetical protein
MSFERFSSSDIYMYEHVGGWIECCGCWFSGWGISVEENVEYFPQLKTPREALEHLDAHENAGHDIGNARNRIMQEYPNLDIKIQQYKPTGKEKIIHRNLMDDIKARYGNEFPPQQFRDRSDGE